jgi:hypothetical protein
MLKIGSGSDSATPSISAPLFEVMRQIMAFEPPLARLPVDAGHRLLIEHHEGGQSLADGGGKVGCFELFQLELDHHVLGDGAPLGGPLVQPAKPVFHLGDTAPQPRGQGLVGQRRPDDGGEDLVQVAEALHRVGEGLLVNLGGVRPEAVADEFGNQLIYEVETIFTRWDFSNQKAREDLETRF